MNHKRVLQSVNYFKQPAFWTRNIRISHAGPPIGSTCEALNIYCIWLKHRNFLMLFKIILVNNIVIDIF